MADKKVRINLGTFDLVKGIGMLAVIFSHMQLNYPLNEVPLLSPVYIFVWLTASGLMPMFFMISGYGFKSKSVGKMLEKTFHESFFALLTSFCVYVILVPLSYYSVFKYDPKTWIEYSVRKVFSWLLAVPTPTQIMGMEVLPIGALWFLMALFWAQNVLNQIVRIKSICGQIVGVCLSVLVGMILLQMNFNLYCLPQGLIAVFFCYIGYILKKQSILEKNLYRLWPYLMTLPVCLIHFWLVGRKGELAFALASGKFGVFDFFASTLSGVLFVFLGVLSGQCNWKGIEWIKVIGVHTYWIMCIHSVEYMGMPWYELAQEKTNSYLWIGIEIFIKAILIAISCMMLKRISRFRYMKKRKGKSGKIRSHQRSGSPVCQ